MTGSKNPTGSRPRKSRENVYWQHNPISREEREARRGHRGAVLWFTGLSASGKSTLAFEVEKRLFQKGYFSYVLDGDNLRHGLNADLSFSPEDRRENIRRVGEVSRLFAESGAIVLTALISPYRQDRDRVRKCVSRDRDFIEIFVSCPLDVCEARDPKGLYARARAGEIRGFTGIDAPYEAPRAPELTVRTDRESVDGCAAAIIEYLEAEGYIGLAPQARLVEGGR